MGEPLLNPRITRFSGYGMHAAADAYLFRPMGDEQVREALDVARRAGRKVTLRGAGRSYGDAAIGAENVVIDLSRMRRILDWDPESGLLEAEAGLTIEGLWRHTLEDGWWPPVVSGTMFPTLAGALAMNIHGKNNFRAGTLGEHVESMDVLFPNGELAKLAPPDPRFYAVVGGAGLLGVILRVRLKMHRVRSGELRVLPISCPNWDAQFEAMHALAPEADYLVSWVDAFASGGQAGRGLVHAAWYTEEAAERPPSLRPDRQDLPDTVLGFLPKSLVWRFLKAFNRPLGMRMINAAKHQASLRLGNGRPHPQSLVAFSFLLDYVPNWRWAYLPGGFLQYQSFVPSDHAPRVFAQQLEWARAVGMAPFLAVLKRHRPDPFLLSHGVDGFSLALDFKVTERRREYLWRLCHRMNDLVLNAGGRFYLAKDSTLRPQDARAYLGDEALGQFRALKSAVDPDHLLTSALAERLRLFTDG